MTMDREDRTVYEGGQGEIIEKKIPVYRHGKAGKNRRGSFGVYRVAEEKVLGCDSQLFCIYYKRRNTL